jgi:hypothetical protein
MTEMKTKNLIDTIKEVESWSSEKFNRVLNGILDKEPNFLDNGFDLTEEDWDINRKFLKKECVDTLQSYTNERKEELD